MDALGKTLGSYRVVEFIGEGGMGHVYRAVHQRLGRQVALKVLKPELAHRADIARRFLEEARAVNDIRNEQIVDIYDFIEDFARTPPLVCMVMELLRGESLARYIARRGALPLSEVVHIGRQVTTVLQAVHGAKILHRDLKAENIFLLEGDTPRQVKLLDFGSIKPLDEALQLHLTDPGTALGTPEYMAPEQVMGDKLDERTDIYAMGVVLYKMLSGSLPFSSASYGGLMVEVLKAKPPSLSGGSFTRSDPVPKALQSVVMRCLQKKPWRRYASMAELGDALAQSANSLTTTGLPSAALGDDGEMHGPRTTGTSGHTPAAFAPTGLQRRHLAIVGVVALVAIIVSGIATWLVRGGTSTRATQAPVAPHQAVRPQPNKQISRPTRSDQDTVDEATTAPLPTRIATQGTAAARIGIDRSAQAQTEGTLESRREHSVPHDGSDTPTSRTARPPHSTERPSRHAPRSREPEAGTGRLRTRRRPPASEESTTVDPFSM